jgi:hypothetical protein
MKNLELTTKTIQEQIFNTLKEAIEPYLQEPIHEDSWYSIVCLIEEMFKSFIQEGNILRFKILCNNICSDLMIEYDIDFSQGFFLYCHLRKGHLKINFVPKEF